ncbi:MAG: Gfo/Idh/MocA family oxidoreductase [Bradyrhizobium sp.]
MSGSAAWPPVGDIRKQLAIARADRSRRIDPISVDLRRWWKVGRRWARAQSEVWECAFQQLKIWRSGAKTALPGRGLRPTGKSAANGRCGDPGIGPGIRSPVQLWRAAIKQTGPPRRSKSMLDIGRLQTVLALICAPQRTAPADRFAPASRFSKTKRNEKERWRLEWTKIEVAVIGTGWCGGIRANACAANPLVSAVHIAENRPERLKEVADAIGAKSATADYRTLLDNKDISAVFVLRDAGNPRISRWRGISCAPESTSFSKSRSRSNSMKRMS